MQESVLLNIPQSYKVKINDIEYQVNYQDIIGEGGYGIIYKCQLKPLDYGLIEST